MPKPIVRIAVVWSKNPGVRICGIAHSVLADGSLKNWSNPLGAVGFDSLRGPMGDTTHVRLNLSDKDRIEELTDDDRSWPGKIQQVVHMAENYKFQTEEA